MPTLQKNYESILHNDCLFRLDLISASCKHVLLKELGRMHTFSVHRVIDRIEEILASLD